MMRKPDQALPISTPFAGNNILRDGNNWAGDERLADSIVCVYVPAARTLATKRSGRRAAALQRIQVHNRRQVDNSDVSGVG